jgi:hypothetical protein
MSKFVLVVCFGLSVVCVAGREHVYNNRSLQLQPANPAGRLVAVAVHDRRQEVVTGDKDPVLL